MSIFEDIDPKTMTSQDQAIIMLIERVGQLETELHFVKTKALEDMKKQTIINSIMSCSTYNHLLYDLCAFMLGCPVEIRFKKKNFCGTKDYITMLQNLITDGYKPNDRLIELMKIIDIPKYPWDLNSDDFITTNDDILDRVKVKYQDYEQGRAYKLMENLTLMEIESYWNWRLRRLQWL